MLEKVFIDGGRQGTLGSWEIERPSVDEARGFHIGSRAKVCPSCLAIWATMEVEGDKVYGIDSQFCERCRVEYSNGVPGSLLDDRQSWTVDWDLIRYLPEVLLKREFELHVRTFLKEDSHEQPRTVIIPGLEPVHIIEPGESSSVPATWG